MRCGQLDVREPPVVLEVAQDRAIEAIHVQIMPHPARSSPRERARICRGPGRSLPWAMRSDPSSARPLPDRRRHGRLRPLLRRPGRRRPGLSVAQACAMSLLVFTGASQFAVVGVLGGRRAASPRPRLPRSCSLRATRSTGCPSTSILPRRSRHPGPGSRSSSSTSRPRRPAPSPHPRAARRAFLATGVSVFVGWNLGSLAGALLGGSVGDPRTLGLDAMFPAAFLALLVPQPRPSGGADRGGLRRAGRPRPGAADARGGPDPRRRPRPRPGRGPAARDRAGGRRELDGDPSCWPSSAYALRRSGRSASAPGRSRRARTASSNCSPSRCWPRSCSCRPSTRAAGSPLTPARPRGRGRRAGVAPGPVPRRRARRRGDGGGPAGDRLRGLGLERGGGRSQAAAPCQARGGSPPRTSSEPVRPGGGGSRPRDVVDGLGHREVLERDRGRRAPRRAVALASRR